jgi:hypothetical protein
MMCLEILHYLFIYFFFERGHSFTHFNPGYGVRWMYLPMLLHGSQPRRLRSELWEYFMWGSLLHFTVTGTENLHHSLLSYSYWDYLLPSVHLKSDLYILSGCIKKQIMQSVIIAYFDKFLLCLLLYIGIVYQRNVDQIVIFPDPVVTKIQNKGPFSFR